jgi:hypothetical protein
VTREVQHGVARARFIAIGIGNHRARVVRHDQLWDAAVEGQRAGDTTQPVLHRLGRRGACECIARCAHGGHEDVRAAPCGQRQRGTGEVDE